MRDTDYFPMDKVLEMWALQSGEPQVNILAALASALIVEALAPWTFQRRGVEIGAMEIVHLAQTLKSSRNADKKDAQQVVAEVCISGREVLVYCVGMGVRPPECLTE